MSAKKFKTTLIKKLRTALVDEVTKIVASFRKTRPDDVLYVFGLYDYVDWSTPMLQYAWNTERNLADTLRSQSGMPAEYYQWKAAGYWADSGSLGATDVIEEMVESVGLEDMEDEEDMEDTRDKLQEICKLQMVLALRDADVAGVFGIGDQRQRVTLLVSNEDEGSSDNWQIQVTSRLLNPDAVYRRFLPEFQRAIKEPELSDAEIAKLNQEIDNSSLAKKFHAS